MARILGLFPAALVAAKQGSSANAFYRELQTLGIGGRRSEVLALFKIAKSIATAAPDEIFRDPSQVPSGESLPVFPTKKATGILQTITLTYRDRETGVIKQTWWRTSTPGGVTRERAIAMAINAYSDIAERYGQDLIGAVHTSAYLQVPFPGA